MRVDQSVSVDRSRRQNSSVYEKTANPVTAIGVS